MILFIDCLSVKSTQSVDINVEHRSSVCERIQVRLMIYNEEFCAEFAPDFLLSSFHSNINPKWDFF